MGGGFCAPRFGAPVMHMHKYTQNPACLQAYIYSQRIYDARFTE